MSKRYRIEIEVNSTLSLESVIKRIEKMDRLITFDISRRKVERIDTDAV